MIDLKLLNLRNLIFTFFYLCPIFIVLGPFFTNIFVLLLFSFCIVYFFKKKFPLKLLDYEKYLIIFIFYLTFTNIFIQNFDGMIKIIYFLIFTFILITFRNIDNKIHFNNKIRNFYLILFCLLSFDGLIQFIFGKNLIGYELAAGNRVSGFFNDEAILGSFISKFIFLLVGILLFEAKKSLLFKIIGLFLFFLFIFIIFLSGERSAFLLSILFLILFFIFLKEIKLLITFIISIIILNIVIFNSNYLESYKSKYLTYAGDIGIFKFLSENYSTQRHIDSEHKTYISTYENIFTDEEIADSLGITIEKVKDLKVNKNINYNSFLNTYHGGLFARAINLSKEKLFFGYGIKKYRSVCFKKDNQNDKILNQNFIYKDNIYKYYCSTHPHNIYLELLVETGLVGLILFLMFIVKFLLSFKRYGYSIFEKSILFSIFCLFFTVFPTGSFFSSQYFIYYLYFIILGSTIIRKNEYN